MPTQKFSIFNFLGIGLLILTIGGFQSTFWFQIFGNFPAPLVWLNVFLYLTLYRKPFEGSLLIYFFAFLLTSFSAQPVGVFWLTLLATFSLVSYFKSRLFWPGPRYFLIASIVTVTSYQVFLILVSHLSERNPVGLLFWRRTAEIFLTPLLAIPIYWLMQWWDRVSIKDLAQDTRSSADTASGVES